MKTIIINCGHSALANGSIYPLTKMRDVATVLDATLQYGEYYGDDRIHVSDENFPIALELLEGTRLLYRIEGVDPNDYWHGVIEGSEYDLRQKRIAAHAKGKANEHSD